MMIKGRGIKKESVTHIEPWQLYVYHANGSSSVIIILRVVHLLFSIKRSRSYISNANIYDLHAFVRFLIAKFGNTTIHCSTSYNNIFLRSSGLNRRI